MVAAGVIVGTRVARYRGFKIEVRTGPACQGSWKGNTVQGAATQIDIGVPGVFVIAVIPLKGGGHVGGGVGTGVAHPHPDREIVWADIDIVAVQADDVPGDGCHRENR